MRSAVAFRQYRRGLRLKCYDFNIRILFLQIFSGSGKSPACSDACNKEVDIAVRVIPDLRPGRLIMCLRVRRVDELAGDKALRRSGSELLRLCDRSLHPFGSVSQDDFRAVRLQNIPALY